MLANDLTDGPSASHSPSSPKLLVANPTSLTPALSVSSLQGSADYNAMSLARQLRCSQDSTTIGKTVMQLNQEAQKEVNRGRKVSTPGEIESSTSNYNKSPKPGKKVSTPGEKESSTSNYKKSPSPGRKESSPGVKESSPGLMESSSEQPKKESSPGRNTSTSSSGDGISVTLRARPVKDAASSKGKARNEKRIAVESC